MELIIRVDALPGLAGLGLRCLVALDRVKWYIILTEKVFVLS